MTFPVLSRVPDVAMASERGETATRPVQDPATLGTTWACEKKYLTSTARPQLSRLGTLVHKVLHGKAPLKALPMVLVPLLSSAVARQYPRPRMPADPKRLAQPAQPWSSPWQSWEAVSQCHHRSRPSASRVQCQVVSGQELRCHSQPRPRQPLVSSKATVGRLRSLWGPWKENGARRSLSLWDLWIENGAAHSRSLYFLWKEICGPEGPLLS